MIPQPINYIEYCKKNKSNLTPLTMFNMRDIPENTGPFNRLQFGDSNIPGTYKGQIELLYVLKSYPKLDDNSKYQLFFITKAGLLAEDLMHSNYDAPINFRTMFLRYIKGFGLYNCLAINRPKTRMIDFLTNVRWEEVIDGVVKPNSYYFYDNEPKEMKSHTIMIYANELTDKPIEVKFSKYLYEALRYNLTYLHLRADNYVDFSEIRPYHPRF